MNQTQIATVRCLSCMTAKLGRQTEVPERGRPLPHEKKLQLPACCHSSRVSEIVHQMAKMPRLGPLLFTETGLKQRWSVYFGTAGNDVFFVSSGGAGESPVAASISLSSSVSRARSASARAS